MRWRWVAALAGALLLTALATDAMAQRRDRDRAGNGSCSASKPSASESTATSSGSARRKTGTGIGRSADLHLVAEGNDIHLINVRLVYFNGFGEDYRVDRLMREGEDQAIELRGDRSFVRQLELTYRARPGFGGRAVMKVYGEPSRRGDRPEALRPSSRGQDQAAVAVGGADWTELGCKQVSLFGRDRDCHRRWPSRRTLQGDPPARARRRCGDARLEGHLCQRRSRTTFRSVASSGRAIRTRPLDLRGRERSIQTRRDGLSHHPELQGPCAGVRRGPAVSPMPAE